MVLSWFSSRTLPIAVDIGTETIKLLQVEPKGEGQHRLLAAACEVIPEEVRGKPMEHDAFVGEAIRKMLTEGFKGKQVVTCLPAGRMAVQHLRIVKMSNDELQKALHGVTTHEVRVEIPVFDNDQDIPRLADKVQTWLNVHPDCVGYLIRGHGLYTWGPRMADALRHVEAFEFLFECELKTRSLRP